MSTIVLAMSQPINEQILGAQLCVLSVHAHPDDKSSKGPGTINQFKRRGIKTVLVCCTGGELGDIENPAMDRPEVRENMGAVRANELENAAKIIGYDHVVKLGYRDSGMAGSDGNFDKRCFHGADLEEAVGRLVSIIRRFKPSVMITYGDNQMGYPHPDHIRVHEVSILAFERAGDPTQYVWAGEPFTPQKLYYNIWSRHKTLLIHEKFAELGIESPFDDRWFDRPWEDHRISARIDVSNEIHIRDNALLAHQTQIDPTSKFWFGIPREVARTIHPYDDYVLARSNIDSILGEDQRPKTDKADEPLITESDLFAGIA